MKNRGIYAYLVQNGVSQRRCFFQNLDFVNLEFSFHFSFHFLSKFVLFSVYNITNQNWQNTNLSIPISRNEEEISFLILQKTPIILAIKIAAQSDYFPNWQVNLDSNMNIKSLDFQTGNSNFRKELAEINLKVIESLVIQIVNQFFKN